jgi:hypothetical protein
MKKTIAILTCFLMSSITYSQETTDQKLYEYPTYEVGMYFVRCIGTLSQIPGVINGPDDVENGVSFCSCVLDKFRSVYPHEDMVRMGGSSWMISESQRFGRECVQDKFPKPEMVQPI